jgi:alkylation response protein AidB-like acyl-CoA dehydrogenase
MIREMVRDFAETKIRPGVMKRDHEGRFIDELIPGLAELGLLGMLVPDAYGGSGLDNVSYALAIEELARVCPSTAVTVSVTNSVCQDPILMFGSEEQKRKYLPPLAKGEWIGGFCLTEPGSGSDAGSLKTRAEKRGGKYILNGSKAWITNTHYGKVFVVIASTDPSKGAKGVSAFIVESSSPGFEFLPLEHKMGLKASVTSGISFDNCEIPAENILGTEGMGMRVALTTLDGSRIGIAAQSVGIAQGAFEEAVKYAGQRETFGKPIKDHQAIGFMIAEMGTEIEAARLMTMKAAALRDAKGPGLSRASSMAKLFASETAKKVCDAAVQIHGAYGYSNEYAVERFYRDARVTTIYEGTSEVQRMVIARSLLGR